MVFAVDHPIVATARGRRMEDRAVRPLPRSTLCCSRQENSRETGAPGPGARYSSHSSCGSSARQSFLSPSTLQQLLRNDEFPDLSRARSDLEHFDPSKEPIDLGFPDVGCATVDLRGMIEHSIE